MGHFQERSGLGQSVPQDKVMHISGLFTFSAFLYAMPRGYLLVPRQAHDHLTDIYLSRQTTRRCALALTVKSCTKQTTPALKPVLLYPLERHVIPNKAIAA